MYDQANEEQDIWFDQIQSMDSIDVVSLMQHNDDFWYSEYILNNAHSFVLLDSGNYELNIPIVKFDHAKSLNSSGLTKIGKDLYCYKRNSLYIIHGGDEKKLSLLSSIEKGGSIRSVSVHIFEEKVIDISNNARLEAFSGEDNCTGYTSGRGQRVKGRVIQGNDYF
ncbi:MAG: hypothetical protein WBA23_06640, partial [Tunicatimonas sp.]|uniref:hypothetical protein n=1 Tax=Tunicatimonas sp. TaxID=1940096 RepID=UPI003C76B023